jgi:predicted double-glycine peptidase
LGLLLLLSASLSRADYPTAPPPRSPAPVRASDNQIQQGVISWKDLRTRYVVMQQRDYSCGAAALATVMRYYWGADITEADVLLQVEKMLTKTELADRGKNGLSIADLRRAAEKMDFNAVIGTVKFAQLFEVKVPVVVALEQNKINHFVVLRGFADGRAYLADPIRGNVRIPISELADQWIANTLLVVAKPNETESKVSVLGIRASELYPTRLNSQLIRTQPERAFAR